ncbi:MAG: hypothetical protein Kow00105_15930 [Phycisphaeraceae bacterium]
MNFLRVKQAQCALSDGRLEEAYELLRQDAIRSHRLGQRLVTRLIKALVRRGTSHLEAGRLDSAWSDCVKAEALGGTLEDVAALRQLVLDAMDRKRHHRTRQAGLIQWAKRHADEGFLSRGIDMLADMTDDDESSAEQLCREIEFRRVKVQASLDRAQSAMKRRDWAAAGHHLVEARRFRPHDRQIETLCSTMAAEVGGYVRQALRQGRTDVAEALLRAVAPVAGDDPAIRELRRVTHCVAEARRMMDRSELHSAGRELRRLQTLLPDADWVNDAVRQIQIIIDARESLEAGPLGLIGDSVALSGKVGADTSDNRRIGTRPGHTIAYDDGVSGDGTGSAVLAVNQMLIQVDGCGAALVVSQPTMTLGPVSSSDRPDVGLIADPAAPTVRFERIQEDYFLRSSSPIKVNGREVTDTLLNDGDKIELSPRCRVRFRIPHAASTTGVIELSGARSPRGDVKRVVMLDRQLVMGAGSACHIRADGATTPIVLGLNQGRLICHSDQPVMAGGEVRGGAQGLPMNAPVCVGEVTFRITPA